MATLTHCVGLLWGVSNSWYLGMMHGSEAEVPHRFEEVYNLGDALVCGMAEGSALGLEMRLQEP